MESDVYSSMKAQRRQSIDPPPDVSEELRIILLGKNGLNSRVGNFILGRDAFNTEAPPPSVEQHSQRARGTVEGRYITLINTPHLFHPQLSAEELNQRVRECMTLGSPGPHVLLLVLQPDDFTEGDRDRLYHILHSLSEDPHKYTLVVTTQKLQPDSSVDPSQEDLVQKMIEECSSMHFEMKGGCSCAELVKVMQTLVEQNGGSHVIWETHGAASPTRDRPFRKSEQTQIRGEIEKLEQETLFPESRVEAHTSTSKTLKPRLNLVLCGRNSAVKESLTDLLLDRKTSKPTLEQSSSVCVRREAEVCGRLITLVELPALCSSQLSEEEVMRETLRCVSLCDPGVHAFLLVLVVPAGPLTDEDKGELEKFQRTFGSRIKENGIVLFTTEFNADRREAAAWLDSETFQLLSMCEGRYRILEKTENGNLKPVPALLDELLSMATSKKPADPSDRQTEDSECLRIVLIGKTGNGKSATGNSILGGYPFESKTNMRGVTSKCQKGFGKVLGKSVAVVDTPGLFDTRFTNEKVTEEIIKCISLSAPGPHAFVIVLTVGRFTKEEMDTVELIKDVFGPEAVKYSIVVFTRGDELAGETIEEYVERCGHDDVNKLIEDCGGRVHMFNNKVNDCSQVTELLRKIEQMIQFNKNSYFTNDMLTLAERTIQRKTEEILRERKTQIQNGIESLQKDYKKEVERKTLHNKRERVQAEVEHRHMKKEFEKHMKLLTAKAENREERKEKELEVEEREREKEQTRTMRTTLRPSAAAAAKEPKHPKPSPKQIIEKFERLIKQDRHDPQSETERRKKTEREQRKRENKESPLQTTKEHENKGQEQKVSEDKGGEEERNMMEKLELERKLQEELKRREEEDRMKNEGEDEEHKKEEKERGEEEREMMEKLELERKLQEELKRREEEDRMKNEREKKRGEEEWKMLEKLELEREWQEELRRREEEDRMRREREKREHEEIKERYEKYLNDLKLQHEVEAREQAEMISDLMPLLEDEVSDRVKDHRGKTRSRKSQCVLL